MQHFFALALASSLPVARGQNLVLSAYDQVKFVARPAFAGDAFTTEVAQARRYKRRQGYHGGLLAAGARAKELHPVHVEIDASGGTRIRPVKTFTCRPRRALRRPPQTAKL